MAGELPIPPGVVSAVEKSGPFAVGALFGCVVSYAMFHLASQERVQRIKVDLDREKELLKQLELKDKRIAELHKSRKK